jgi:hypothetical protein
MKELQKQGLIVWATHNKVDDAYMASMAKKIKCGFHNSHLKNNSGYLIPAIKTLGIKFIK